MSQQTTDRSFDDLARALAEGSISRRRALKLFAGSAIAALIPSRALALQQKVIICHKPGTPAEQTKEVPERAVDNHLDHGDRLGACGESTTTTSTSTSTSSTTSTSTSTSTTTPTTSTSTSTTSTTTMCLPIDSPCMANDQCCSGNCDATSGTCGVPRHVFNCLCDDGTIPEECLPLECGPSENFTIACEQLCANRGGCSNTECSNSGCGRATC